MLARKKLRFPFEDHLTLEEVAERERLMAARPLPLDGAVRLSKLAVRSYPQINYLTKFFKPE